MSHHHYEKSVGWMEKKMLFEVVMMYIIPLQEDIIKTQLIGYNKCCCLSQYIRCVCCVLCDHTY